MPAPSSAAWPWVELLWALLAAVGLLQGLLTAGFAALVHRRLHPAAVEPQPGAWPEAEVVLCLRGADPTLPACLAALAAQQYPAPWRLLLLVDGPLDPAWAVAEAALTHLQAQPGTTWRAARLVPLQNPPATGSLKSAALHQAFGELHPSTALVALVDADALVSPSWLAALARSCARPGVGAAGGNRWYLPARRRGPAMARAIWNGGALVLMTLLEIAWGGSLAVRRPLIESSGWRRQLRSSLCEDTALTRPLRQAGWRYCFEPELLVVDREEAIAWGPLVRWISRQLLMARLHHPAWPLVVVHGLGTSALLLAVLVGMLVALLLEEGSAALGLLAGLLLYELGCGLLLVAIQAVVLQAIQPGDRIPLAQWLRWLPLGQAVYGLAIARACLARRVEWRGVHYRLGRGAVHRLGAQR
jgi:hypothetical protein